MKIMAKLGERGTEFDLLLNGRSIYDYKRYVDQTDDESLQVDGKLMKKIRADFFNINGVDVLETKEKSVQGVKNTLDRLVKQNVTKMELQNLVCSPSNFI